MALDCLYYYVESQGKFFNPVSCIKLARKKIALENELFCAASIKYPVYLVIFGCLRN